MVHARLVALERDGAELLPQRPFELDREMLRPVRGLSDVCDVQEAATAGVDDASSLFGIEQGKASLGSVPMATQTVRDSQFVQCEWARKWKTADSRLRSGFESIR